MSRSTLDPDGAEARGNRQLGDGASLTEPSQKVPGARPSSGVGEWLLELGAAKREAAERSLLHEEQGHRVRAWSSRRARRLVVRQALAGAATAGPTEEPAAPVEAVAAEPVQPDLSREDTVEVPAVEVHMVPLPPVEPELVEEPSVVRLPPMVEEADEPEPADEPQLVGVAVASEDELDSEAVVAHSSMLLERISAYTLSSRLG